MGCSSVRPDCSADLATLATTQKALGVDMRDLKTTVHDLEITAAEQGTALSNISRTLTDEVVPALKNVPLELAKYRSECPVYAALDSNKKNKIQKIINQDEAPKQNTFSRALESRLLKVAALIVVGALGAFVKHFWG